MDARGVSVVCCFFLRHVSFMVQSRSFSPRRRASGSSAIRSALALSACLGCLSIAAVAHAQVRAVDPSPPSHAVGAARTLEKPWVLMDLGLSGALAARDPTLLAFGMQVFGLRIEWPHGAVLLVPRFFRGNAVHGGNDFITVSGSLGGRYLFTPYSTSLFVGGGASYGLTALDGRSNGPPDANGNGPGSYVEAGIELFRSSGHQLSFGVRLDTPFYRAVSDASDRKVYVAPLSLDVTVSLPWQALAMMR